MSHFENYSRAAKKTPADYDTKKHIKTDMKVFTNFWTNTDTELDNLLFYHNGTNEVVFKLEDFRNPLKNANFFKDIANFQSTKKNLATLDTDHCYQCATMIGGNLTPIKWFDIKIGSKTIKLDHAFDTQLVTVNGRRIMLGCFPSWEKIEKGFRYPKYREFKINKRAFKFVANKLRANKDQ